MTLDPVTLARLCLLYHLDPLSLTADEAHLLVALLRTED